MRKIASIAANKYVVVGIFSMFLILGSTVVVAEQLPSYCPGICDLAWSPVEETLLGAVDEFGLWLYDTNEPNNVPRFFPHEFSISLSFDPTGQFVAVTSCPGFIDPFGPCNGMVSLFDLQEQSWTTLGVYKHSIGNVKFSPDGRYLAFANDEIGTWGVQLIDLLTNTAFTVGDRFLTDQIDEYAFDPQSNTIAISNGYWGYEGHAYFGISVWRISDQTVQAYTQRLWARDIGVAVDLAFTETETEIIFVEYDTEVFIWNYRTGHLVSSRHLVETREDNIHRVSFSDPPTYLLAAIFDENLHGCCAWQRPGDRVLFGWDIQSGEHVFFRDMPKDSFADSIAINLTGEYVAFSSTVEEQKLVWVWERTTGSSRQVTFRSPLNERKNETISETTTGSAPQIETSQ